MPKAQAEQQVFLRPGAFIVDQGEVKGAGRVHTPLVRILEVLVDNRVSLDTATSDEIWLTDASRGYIPLEELILDAFQMFFPEDSNQDLLTAEPIRELAGDMSAKEIQKPGWGDDYLRFEVRYLPPLNQNFQ